LQWRKSANIENTGGGSVIACASIAGTSPAVTDIEHVTAIPFDEIARGAGKIDLLKIDAEGSEYPILLTSGTLDRVGEIVGEYHVLYGVEPTPACSRHSPWNMEHLAAHLIFHGFDVQIVDKGMQGLFRAYRTGQVSA